MQKTELSSVFKAAATVGVQQTLLNPMDGGARLHDVLGAKSQDPARAAVSPRRGACGVHRGNCSVFWDFQVPESHLIPSKAARLRPLWKSLGRHVHVPYLRCSFVYSFINSFKGYLFTPYGRPFSCLATIPLQGGPFSSALQKVHSS